MVISGVGVVSPVGIGNDAFWGNLCAAHGGVGLLPPGPDGRPLPVRLGAEVRDFDPLAIIPHRRKFLKAMGRDVQLGVSSATLAMSDAGLAKGDVTPERLGVEFGTGRISIEPETLRAAAAACRDDAGSFLGARWGEAGMREIAPLWLLRQLPNMSACHVSIDYDARGPNNTITSREASALLALDEAVRTVRRDAADVMIVGATGSNTNPVDVAKLSLSDELSHRSDDPQHALRPFDVTRDGGVVGEGAATLIVEEYEHAVRRGADIYCEILGVASGSDGADRENGSGLVNAMRSALRQGGLEHASQIGHINAHGLSTRWDDLVESRAYRRLFGDDIDGIPITALKSYFGNFEAGSGAVELAGSILALRHRHLPMTLGFQYPDPNCRINVVHDGPMPLTGRTAMTVNRTGVGQSVAAVIQAV